MGSQGNRPDITDLQQYTREPTNPYWTSHNQEIEISEGNEKKLEPINCSQDIQRIWWAPCLYSATRTRPKHYQDFKDISIFPIICISIVPFACCKNLYNQLKVSKIQNISGMTEK